RLRRAVDEPAVSSALDVCLWRTCMIMDDLSWQLSCQKTSHIARLTAYAYLPALTNSTRLLRGLIAESDSALPWIVENLMRSLISTLMVSVVCAAAYFYFLKRAAPVPGMAATQAISITGVAADLTAITQADPRK